jgi:hypothetical protein
MQKVKSFLINFSLVSISTIVVLIVCEILLRIFGHQDIYLASSYPAAMFDKKYSSRMKPNFSGDMVNSEFSATIKLNSKGLRDVERIYQKQDNVFRILGIGDSFVFGHGIEYEQSFLALLEMELQKINKGKFEIVKAGVPGMDLEFYKNYYLTEGKNYQPDLLLINIFLGNDISKLAIDGVNPKYDIENPEVRNENLFKASLRKNIHLYSFVVDKLKSSSFIREHLISSNLASGLSGSYVLDVLKKESNAEYIAKWKLVEQIIKDLKVERKKIVLVFIPSREQVDERKFKNAANQLGYNTNDLDRMHPNKMLIEICNRNQIGFIDVTNDLVAERSNNQTLFFDIDPHINFKGHQEVAKSLMKRFSVNKTDNGFVIF